MSRYYISTELKSSIMGLTGVVENITKGHIKRNVKTDNYNLNNGTFFISKPIAEIFTGIDIPVNKAIASDSFPYYVDVNTIIKWLQTHDMQRALDNYHLSYIIKPATEYFNTGLTVKRGQHIYIDMSKYIIGGIGANEVILINLDDGNRFTGSLRVQDYQEITEDEFNSLVGGTDFEDVRIEV